ncbi:hypothetical protein FB567DRAFT_521231 [Paraphoma chrysanthemicola]|uniref:DUF6594 domain-containing protein n=1 Tax=Paraphoma chrysanthemicola TaxID=798071 RepID=A0A8K0R7T1_9PLEO|nr:hypothetical protein FB567DRAFT_521231 [Paraphoma chrysanthemicola]
MIEDKRQGYPRYTALIDSHPTFLIFRRFSRLRARLLLRKQDQLSVLEKQLDILDSTERTSLFLASSSLDGNTERQGVLDRIETVLMEYDTLIDRIRTSTGFPGASSRDVSSLKNWLMGNACLARSDWAYLSCDDLFYAAEHDSAIKQAEAFIVDRVLLKFTRFTKRSWKSKTRDPHVYIPGAWTVRIARLLIATVVILALMTPVLVCSFVGQMARIIIVALSTSMCITMLVMTVQVRTIELIVAGTTYATVMTVFVSGNLTIT